MQKYIVPVIAGFVAAFVVAFLLSAINMRGGILIYCSAFVGVFTAYILANLAGNRKVATADAAAKAAALAMTPPPGKALIYAYRDGFVGMAAGLNLSVDDKPVAQLKSPRFTCVTVSPGTHTVGAAFGGLAGPQNKGEVLTIAVAEGGVYVFKFGVSMGALQNSIKADHVPDLAAAKAKMSGMSMTVPDLAEV